jgi:hypothetical protein
MQITVIDVTENTKKSESGRTFQQLEVAYKNEQGQPQLKKLISFSNPNVFKAAKEWVKGDVVNVTTVKNEKTGYWDWIGLEGDGIVAETKQASASVSIATGARVTGSNYETKEERAARQVFIIRQSSLSTAVELLGQGKSVADVIATAKQFEAYVFSKAEGVDAINEIQDDIPV